ncbi:hypothetical protein JCM17846_20610 [Iodidimonas nitroreducens]|uniref:Glutathione S-transferase n=1 Tax=Iodidimonas nitroreducens TaxID=1236968 RepID=A0A5A7NBF6_9PROT|nr:MAPEG family protein [Iodidimonas nitroreducens]GAK33446.1 putative relative of glutathione S-transferase, MAPEG superfamily [alpha proteobacterium Q-1]GER04379.1 hypothetical protein JCM17846_20610 [Iodidimonas nitroreducens]
MSLPITLLAASLLVSLFLILIVRNIQARLLKIKADQSGGASPEIEAQLNHRMRVVANFSEYAPLGLVILGALEAARAPTFLVMGVAIALVLGRILHAWGFSRSAGASFGRMWGTIITLLTLIVAALGGLYTALLMG